MSIRRLTNLQLLRTSRGPSITSRSNLLALARSLSTSTRAFNPLFKGTPGHFDRVQSQHRSMASVSAQKATDFGDFELLQSFPIKYAPVTVSKWRSKKTGLTVVVGSHDTPITNGHFTIASEIFDDTGRPHTLEHLIFLGSKDYPYKGVLDHLANRAGSNGTNAWTANDHTAYTIATAGSEGFLNMLPIYIDHILHPTITDAGFVTEVHHINGKGEDAGVVYSEMQARENQAGDLVSLNLQRALYPESSAYRSETGGLMAKLRVLTAQQIRDYHSSYYVPHNLCLLIDGGVPLPDLFKVLTEKVEPLILSHLPENPTVPPPGWKRPFVETSTSKPFSISKPQSKVVEFMEEDESIGEVYLSFLGPKPTDYRENLALKILGQYLTDSATAPLQKEFVEIPKPLCTGVGFYSEDRVNKNEITVFASDVPTKHLETLGGQIRGKLAAIAKTDGIDMERMALVLRRDKRKLLNSMESRVSAILADAVIGDFLYGDADGKDLAVTFEDIADYEVLSSWSAKDWAQLLDRYFVSSNCITMVGKPSAALAAKIEHEEKERLEKRRQELGEDKLKELEEAMQKAKKESETPPPPKMISDFPITDPKTLTWVPVETAVNNVPGQQVTSDNGELQRYLDQDGIELPFQAHFAGVKSNFVSVSALFDTAKIPSHLKPYVSVFSNALFTLGVRRADGSVLSHEQVVDQLSDFTVSQSAYFRSVCSEIFTVGLKVEQADYEKAIAWIRDIISGCIFDKDRLSVIIAKQLQELPYEKRDGSSVARAWVNRLVYDIDRSTSEAASLLSLLEFIPATAKALEEDPNSVISALEEVRKYLLDPSIVRVSIAGDITSTPNPKATLARNFFPYKESKPLQPVSTAKETLTPLGEKPGSKMVLVPMAAIEGSNSLHFAKGPVGWSHPDLPALRLASAVLNAAESYLWTAVRGSGLAYGANMEVDAESGFTGFSVYRSGNAKEAYETAGNIIRRLADGSVELDQNFVDGARSTLTYDYARRSETMAMAAATAYVNEVLKGVSKDEDRLMLERLPHVTVKDIQEAIRKYFLPVFDSATSIGAVTVNSGKAAELEEGFSKLGFEVERRELPQLGAEASDSEGSESGDEGSDSGMEDDSIGYSKAEVSVPPIDRRRVVSTLSYKLCLILAMRLFCRALKTSTVTPALTTVRAMSKVREVPLAPRKEDEDVWSYPRPPLLQRTPNRLRVIWTAADGTETVIADTTEGYRVLETSHPPTYYLPPSALKVPLTKTPRSTYCEWKGSAAYHAITPPGAGKPIVNRIWSYPSPTPGFTPLKDYLSFYASTGQSKQVHGGEWRCYVDDEQVGVQEGDFYGGWVTSNIKGKMKGGPGTWGW